MADLGFPNGVYMIGKLMLELKINGFWSKLTIIKL